jgi:HlyD family secretion protein
VKKLIVTLAVLWAGGTAGYIYWSEHQRPDVEFRTVPVRRGDLSIHITTTGTLEPVEVIDVGPQVPGQIKSFGTDLDDPSKAIDFGSRVEKGTVLANLEDSLYRAQLSQAQANLTRAEADLEFARIKAQQAERDFERERKLMEKGTTTPQNFENALAAFQAAKATVSVNEGSVELARANVQEAQVNIEYATLRSPSDGVVIDRRVNLGQSVVANVSATSLFLIAEDLSRLEIWASVNETDVGSVHPGQDVQFTVSAFPDEEFHGTVSQIRLNASMIQNVVTYTCVIDVDNRDKRLLPYLTARVQFQVAGCKDALLVPNAALRWTPRPDQIEVPASPGLESTTPETHPEAESGPSAPQTPSESPGRVEETKEGVVWLRRGDFVRPVRVRLGLSDGVLTEVLTDKLHEGDSIVVGEDRIESAHGVGGDGKKTVNPFVPQIKKDKDKGGDKANR